MKSLLGSRLVPSLGLLLTTIWLCGLPHSTARAQVPPKAVNTDIVETTRAGLDLGTRTTVTVDLPTNVTTTAITGGTRPAGGPNLFHSFDSFSVGTKDIAHFQNDMMLPTTNIIARVIGDAAGLRQASTIDGILRTNNPLNALDPLNFGAANLFLVNPAGIIFGPNAQLDIKGSFTATTADYLRMTDGALFRTDPAQPSVLSIANVASFGFTSPRPVAITVQGAQLAVPTDQTLSIIGGDISVAASAPGFGAVISAPSGQINLASVASAGEVIPNQPGQLSSLDVSSFTELGQISHTGLPSGNFGVSNLSVSSSQGAGTIFIRGGGLTTNGAVINANTTGAGNGNPTGIDIQVTDSLLASGRSQIVAFTSGSGRAGNIVVNAGTLHLTDPGTIMNLPVFNTGDGGSLAVTAGTVEVVNGGQTGTFTTSAGRPGNVTVQADNITALDGGSIFSNASGTGKGGTMEIIAKEITASAANLATVPGCAQCFTGIQASTGFGSPGGLLRVTADNITLSDGGRITTNLFSTGPGANLEVNAKNITISGTVTVASPNGPMTHFAGIDALVSGSFARGTGGNITVDANAIDISKNGSISSSLLFGAPGNAGNIIVRTDDLNIHDSGGIFATSFLGSGNSGNIDITANAINISGVRTSLDPGGVADFTGLSASTAAGRGGTIRVTTDDLLVTNKGAIASTTFSSGAAGSINITAADVSVTDAGFIIASTAGSGAGGNIDIAAGRVSVSGEVRVPGALDTGVAAITAQAKAGSGNAGTIKITADEIDVLNKGIINNDTLSSGQGGTIELNAASVRVANGGEVTAASSSTGAAGSILVNAKDVTVTGVANSLDPIVTDFTGFSVKTVNGPGGTINLASDNISLSDKGSISSLTTGTGNAGTVDLNIANTLSLSSGGLISATTSGAGAGGTINVIANQASLATGGTITASTSGTGNAGSITLNTTNLSLLSSGQITTSSTSTQANAGKAGSIAIQGVAGAGSAADSLLVSGTNSLVSTTTAGPGQGGNIQIKAGQIQVEQLAKVTAETSGKGQAGNVTMTGDSFTIASGGRIEASTAGEGKGGEIAITTNGDMTVSGVSTDGQTRSGIFAKTQTSSTGTGGGGGGGSGGGSGGGGTSAKPGNAGNITIASKNLLLNSGAQIDSSTTSGGAGGNVSITTTNNITIAGSSTRLTSDATRGDGKGGSITLVAKNITVADSASVTAATGGKGDAGNVTLTALDQLLLQSAGTITTSTSGSGKGGTITIQAGQVMLDGPGTGIAADTLRPFADLTITINILHQNDGDLIVQLDSPTGTRVALFSRVGGTGDDFTDTQFNDQATTLIASGSAPFTGTFKPREPLGQLINELVAGNWTLNVRDQATGNIGTLENWTLQIGQQTFQSTGAPKVIPDNGTLRSTITVAVPAGSTVPGVGEAPGIGGDVTVNAGTVTVQKGATISATTRGSGQGGTLIVNATGLVALAGPGSGLFTESEASGGSGNINVAASRMTLDKGAKVSAASASTDSTAGNAGSITIQGITGSGSPAADVSLDNSNISTTISGGSAATTPGAITITAQTLALANDAHIGADTTGAAPAGDITLNVGTLTVGSSGVLLPPGIPQEKGGGGFEGGGFGFFGITSNSGVLELDQLGQPILHATAGNAGSITIQGITGSGSPAADVRLDSSLISTQIFGGSAANTPATITITAHTLALANGAGIAANTVGTAPAGDIALNVGTLTVGDSREFGVFSGISSGSFIDDSTAGNAGSITIQGVTGSGSPAADVSLDSGQISTEIFGGSAANTPATITITAQTLALLDSHASDILGIRADTNGAAPAGDITLNVGTLTAGNSTFTSSSSSSDSTAGNAGNITIQGVTGFSSPAAHVSLDNSGISTVIYGGTSTSTPATITITAQTLALANADIAASTVGAAPAGDITLKVGTLTVGSSRLLPGGCKCFSGISSDSSFPGGIDIPAGNAGSITIQGITGSGSPAANVSLDSSTISTQIFGGSAATTPGTITITAQTLALANVNPIETLGIRADTHGEAPAGDITLNVGTLMAGNSKISSSSSFPSGLDIPLGSVEGNAGNITIQGITGSGSPAAHVSLDNSNISTTIAGGTLSSVPANITIAAQSVTLSKGGAITASTTGNAPAGNIGLVTQQLTMTPDSAITSNAQEGGGTTGRAGSITITGAGSAPTTIAGGTIQAQSETIAIAGDITLHAPGDLTLLGTTVSVKNTGPGDAGSIDLRAGNDLLVRNSQVSTESAEASGGNIKLTAPNLVRIVDSTLTSSVQGQAGSNGGNINIDPQFVVIQNSQLLANANAGAGGNITITATGAVLVDPNSRIDASAGPAGVSGSVNINAPIQVLSGALVPLTQSFLSGNSLSNQRCAARMAQGQISTFIVTEREGLPQEPGGMLLSSLVETDDTAASETIEPIRVASVSQSSFTPLTPEPVQLTWTDDTCRR